MFSIIVSKQDAAGMLMKELFVKEFDFSETNKKFDKNPVYSQGKFELITINKNQIFADYLNGLETDFFVFASKHASKSGKPTLTAHGVGNWGPDNTHGGKAFELVPTSATLIRNYLKELQKQKEEKKLDYDVIAEVTHHGPLLEKPAVFIELGSSEQQWNDEAAARAIVETILNATNLKEKVKAVIGVGGQHYQSEFTKLMLRSQYGFSHMCPKYNLQNFNAEMLQKAIEATCENIEEIVVDFKGLGQEKERIMELLEKQELPLKRVRELK